MPYRRLPKTDAARQKALNTVLEQGKIDGIYSTIVSQKSQHEAQVMLRRYEQALYDYKESEQEYAQSSKKMQQYGQKARMYVSHFIQVLNLCVIRGEITAENKELYGLSADSNTVPDLSTDKKLIEWGQAIIKGETLRQQRGGVPLYNPNIARVRAFFDPFESDMEDLKIKRGNVVRFQGELNKVREKVDEILLDIWNQVESAFADQPLAERLQSCQQYGLIYYYRRGEEKL